MNISIIEILYSFLSVSLSNGRNTSNCEDFVTVGKIEDRKTTIRVRNEL